MDISMLPWAYVCIEKRSGPSANVLHYTMNSTKVQNPRRYGGAHMHSA